MWVQAVGLWLTAATQTFGWWLLATVLLGVETAMVYPKLIAAVSDASHPLWRPVSSECMRYDSGKQAAARFAQTVPAFVCHPSLVGRARSVRYPTVDSSSMAESQQRA